MTFQHSKWLRIFKKGEEKLIWILFLRLFCFVWDPNFKDIFHPLF